MSNRKHLLWIDDDADHLLSPLRRLLMSRGFDVDVALDYSTAKEMLASKTYDAILADVILPISVGRGAVSPYLGHTLLSDVRSGKCFESSTGVGTPPGAVFAFLSVVPQQELSISTSEQPFVYFSKATLLEPGVIDSMISALRGDSSAQET